MLPRRAVMRDGCLDPRCRSLVGWPFVGRFTAEGLVLYWVVKAVLWPILKPLYRPWAEGVDNIPADGGALIASNHLSYLDWIFLPLLTPRRIWFLAKADYFTEKGVKGWLKKAFFTGTGQVPIARTGGSASADALETGKKILAEGRLLGLYPEGTRSPDGRLYRGKTGIARMAIESGKPVIPVAMIGLFEVAPPGRILPKVKRVGLRVGEPLDFTRYTGMDDTPQVLRSITDEIMAELMRLSGQEYVDRYAAEAKAEQKAAQKAAHATARATRDGRAGADSADGSAEDGDRDRGAEGPPLPRRRRAS